MFRNWFKPKNEQKFTVQAEWDGDACVWVATSDDFPGLVAESDTFEGLAEELRLVIPELLELNGFLEHSAPAPAPPDL